MRKRRILPCDPPRRQAASPTAASSEPSLQRTITSPLHRRRRAQSQQSPLLGPDPPRTPGYQRLARSRQAHRATSSGRSPMPSPTTSRGRSWTSLPQTSRSCASKRRELSDLCVSEACSHARLPYRAASDTYCCRCMLSRHPRFTTIAWGHQSDSSSWSRPLKSSRRGTRLR